MKFDKVRFRYLYSQFSPKSNDLCKLDHYHAPVQRHPHTCIAVKVDSEKGEIRYAIARRESNGKLLSLKNRMKQIRALGGIVPENMIKAVCTYPKDYSKATARAKALLKLEKCPHVISGLDVSKLNAHIITQHVMYALRGDADFDYSAEVVTAAEAATDWLREHDKNFDENIILHLATDPMSSHFMEALDRAAKLIGLPFP
jgi:hypothetical protein